jgi:YrbI family 3-deoxy-D-manno-octulosonate 8-phosphate phosphatase
VRDSPREQPLDGCTDVTKRGAAALIGFATMSVLCVIPARGGSKGILRKNLQKIGGISLIGRAVRSGIEAQGAGTVLVSTDDDEIAAEAQRYGATIVRRPDHLGVDTASSESALLHALEAHESARGETPDVLVFLQCTSPFIDPADIDRAIEMVTSDQFDSVFSAAPSHAFIWRSANGTAVGENHDWRVRERRQDRPEEFRETGAIYVMRTSGFIDSGHRFFGRVGICQVPESHGIDIDDEGDLARARFMASQQSHSPLTVIDPAKVSAFVTDFDGVHTDNLATVDQHGIESVTVNRSDGLGLAALRSTGLPMFILSTEKNPVVAARAEKLGMECVHGSDDKLSALREWSERNQIDPSEILYIGNDTNDLGCLGYVGWPVAVSDSHPAVLNSGAIVTSRPGGLGAIREVTDHLLGRTPA